MNALQVRPILVAAMMATCAATAEVEPVIDGPIAYPTTDKRHYLEPKDINFVRPGLIVDAGPDDVSISADGTVSLVFSVTDDRGLPLDIDGVTTPGSIRINFVLANIPAGEEQYMAYTTRVQTSPITGDSAEQPTSDSGGTLEEIEVGTYRYTFGTQLPAGYDADTTHTIGIYASRDLGEFELGTHVDNELVHFVPAGGEPMPREVVTTEACNTCHDPLAIHGGRRTDTGLCIMCHTDGVIDPDTGNTVDMKVMIHKIHMGENLPSVQAGEPYQIIGFRQSVHDYSDVTFPQDIRNCTTCHTDAAAMAEAWNEDPGQEACGSCHDDVVFASGENHAGGPALSDNFCANCHFPEGELEFDASVMGAHTVPAQSEQLAGINIEILEVTNAFPGENPTARFSVTNDAGEAIDITGLRSFSMLIAGPNESYEFLARENAQDGAVATSVAGEYTYTFETPLPEFAMGSYTAGAEASRNVVLNAGTTGEFTHRETADPNPSFPFAVTDTVAMARRIAVTDEKCEACHENLEFHGGNRHEPQYCVMCHQPGASDVNRRPEEEMPPRSIHFKFMVHRIHRGEDLTGPYTVYGFGNRPHDYTHVLYPGDLRNCETCHVNDSQQLPAPGLPTTETLNEFFDPLPASTAACLGCHDTLQAAAHAFLNIAPFGEACATCHGPGKEASVDKVHARIGQ